MKKQYKIILAFLFLIGFLIRVWNVGSLPQILNRDEAALAYNGLLLSQTGQDEFSQNLPLTLESFGDYKLPGYPYTLALLFKVLPINDFTVRLPSIFAGTILILLSFYLAKNFKFKNEQALFFSFLITLSPLFLFYSRIAFEANVALTIFVGAITLLTIKKPKLKTDLLAFGLIFLAILFYNTPLLLLPFLIISLIIGRGLKQPKKWLPTASLLTILFVLMFLSLASISSQKSGITIFSDETTWHESVLHYNNYQGIWQKVLGNKFVFYLSKIWPRFFESFSMHFLVSSGGSHPWHNLPQHAHLYYTSFFISLIGILILIKNSLLKSKPRFLLLMLFSSLTPSVITIDSPHATRSLLFIYLFAFTGTYFLTIIKKKYYKKILTIIILLIGLETGHYLYLYFNKYPVIQPPSLKSGYQQIIQETEEKYPQEKIAIVDKSGYQYILTAWYLKTSPQQFFNTIIKQLPDKIGFKYGQQLTHYHFIAHRNDRDEAETVLVEWIDNQWQVHQF
jgi:4-amino-4-deoxy-L-arabinose transferase-like glycosyltransferase